jgi:outer membrane protein TolC
MQGKTSKLGLALLLTTLALPGVAHETPPSAPPEIIQLPRDNQLTLAEVVEQAAQRYPDYATLEARLAELEAQRRAGSTYLSGAPTLNVSHQNDAAGSGNGLREWEVGLELPLWWPGQRQAMQTLGDSLAMEMETWEAALRLTVAGKVRELAWETALQENLTTLAEQEWDTALTLEKDVRRRVEAGELARGDLLLAQDETLRKQADYLDAETRLARAVESYRLFTGLDKLPAQFEETAPKTVIGELAEARWAGHPLLREAQAAIDCAQAELQLAKQERGATPQLSVNARRERADRDSADQDSVGLSLRLPLGASYYHGPRIAAALRALADAYSTRDRLLRELQLAAKEAEQAWQTARDTLRLAEEQKRLAEENLRLAQIAFKAGESEFIHLQRVQTLAFSADRAVLARRLQLKSALARYRQALGILP